MISIKKECFVNAPKKTLFGVGINDSGYKATAYEVADGKSRVAWRCPYYSVWSSMFVRCYSQAYQSRRPTYVGCTVDERWHYFSAFRVWMESQKWQGKELDKDILVKGNKVYSPENCAFVDSMTNSFILDCRAISNELPIGVTLSKNKNKYRAQCNNPFTGKRDYIGTFDSKEAAHSAWADRKKEHALLIAAAQEDKRVSAALIARFSTRGEK